MTEITLGRPLVADLVFTPGVHTKARRLSQPVYARSRAMRNAVTLTVVRVLGPVYTRVHDVLDAR